MLGATAGFFAALALALSPLFFGFARFATLDPALAFFLTAALGAFYLAAREDSFSRPSSRRWMLISAAMLAMGTLAKGPIALLLGGAIAVMWLAVEHRLREIAQMPLVWCGVIYAAIVLPWFILMEARNPGFLRFFFIHEHFERYVSSSEHGWGPWFFIPIVIGGMWPWIFFVPLGWSAMRHDTCRARASLSRRSAATFSPSGSSSSSYFSRFPAPSSAATSFPRCHRWQSLQDTVWRGCALSRTRVVAVFSPSLRLQISYSWPLSSYFSNSLDLR